MGTGAGGGVVYTETPSRVRKVSPAGGYVQACDGWSGSAGRGWVGLRGLGSASFGRKSPREACTETIDWIWVGWLAG